jgi:hypothetical protein
MHRPVKGVIGMSHNTALPVKGVIGMSHNTALPVKGVISMSHNTAPTVRNAIFIYPPRGLQQLTSDKCMFR